MTSPWNKAEANAHTQTGPVVPLTRCRGMTLIEVILVVSLLLLIASASVARIESWVHTRLIEQSRCLVVSELRSARLLAVESVSPTCLQYTPGTANYVVSTLRGPSPRQGALRDGVIFSPVLDTYPSSQHHEVWFLPDGTCQQSLIRIEDRAGATKAIHIRRHTGGE